MLATILGVGDRLCARLVAAAQPGTRPAFEFLRATPAAAIVPGALLLFHANVTYRRRRSSCTARSGRCCSNTAAARAALPPLRLDVAHALRLSLVGSHAQDRAAVAAAGDRRRRPFAAPVCLIVTLLVDFLVATGGIGYLLVQYQQTFLASSAFAMLAVIGIIGILINLALGSARACRPASLAG